MAAMTLLLVPLSSVFHINYESAFGERKIYLAYISITVLFFLSAAYIFFCKIIFLPFADTQGTKMSNWNEM